MVSLIAWLKDTCGNRFNIWFAAGLSLLLVTLISSCEDPGVVGSGFVETGAEVNLDTLKVDDFKVESGFPVFTGNKPYLSVGAYNDQLFGDLTATGVIKPVVSQSVDTLHPDASFGLELGISTANVYGDTTSTTTVELVEMAEPWRGVAWKIDSDVPVSDNVVATADINMEDSLVIDLPDSWYQKYREYFYENPNTRDSLYRYNFKGLALRPVDGNKIVAINASKTSFVFQNPGDTVKTELDISGWGYSLDRQNVPTLPDSLDRIYSTQENAVNFIFESDRETLGSENIARGEMVFDVDRERMRNSLPGNHVRPTPDIMGLYLHDPKDLKYSLSTFNTAFEVQLDSVDYTFRFDLTRYVNQQLFVQPSSDRFIGALLSTNDMNENDGIIRSTVLSNPKARYTYPRLLLTFVNSDIESN